MTAKQKAARLKFKKVVAEATKLRKKNPKLTQAEAIKKAWAMEKKVGAIKIIEKGESKKAKPKATYQQVRTKKGTYKGLKKVGAASSKVKAKKRKLTEMHTDTKSHNVNIRVVSGIIKAKPSVILLSKKIQKFTDFNDHNKAVLELAKFLKDKKNVILINNVIKMADSYGYMPSQLSSIRNQLLDNLLSTFKNKYGEIDYKLIYHSF